MLQNIWYEEIQSRIVELSLEFWYRARERITFIKRNCISTIHPYSRASFQVPPPHNPRGASQAIVPAIESLTIQRVVHRLLCEMLEGDRRQVVTTRKHLASGIIRSVVISLTPSQTPYTVRTPYVEQHILSQTLPS